MTKTTTVTAAIGALILGFVIGTAGHDATAGQAPHATHTSAPPPATATPTTVLSITGTGIKNTAAFTTGPEWSVGYAFDCADFGTTGNFILSVDGAGDTLANALAVKGSDISYEHGRAGTHYLSVNSECTWALKVVNG